MDLATLAGSFAPMLRVLKDKTGLVEREIRNDAERELGIVFKKGEVFEGRTVIDRRTRQQAEGRTAPCSVRKWRRGRSGATSRGCRHRARIGRIVGG